MGVRIYVKPLAHPSECDVCEHARQVSYNRVASQLSVIIPCPQCAGAEELISRLPVDPPTPRGAA